jgi:hypothetical protein
MPNGSSAIGVLHRGCAVRTRLRGMIFGHLAHFFA